MQIKLGYMMRNAPTHSLFSDTGTIVKHTLACCDVSNRASIMQWGPTSIDLSNAVKMRL